MLYWKYIIIPFSVAFLSQCLKILIEFFRYKKISFRRFINGMGGMPSTHSALVSSICTIIYLDYGMSSLFAITLIFSLIVMYDSMGVRYESGKQAKVINGLVGSALEENLGHKPIEVLAGAFIGVSLTFLFNIIIK